MGKAGVTTVWDAQYAEGKGVRRWPSETLLGFLAKQRFPIGSRVLEVGCGAGGNCWAVNEGFLSSTGLDASYEALRQAKTLFNERVQGHLRQLGLLQSGWEHLIQADARALPFQPETFDAVVDVTTLQHLNVSDKLAALREARRVLKPGGWFFSQHLAFGTENYEDIFPGNPPVFLWDKVSAQLDLDRAGLDLDHAYTMRREYPGVGWAEYLVVEARATA